MDARTQQAIDLMMRYAERTGLISERPPQRYLWTDAFAVCNLLGLARATGLERYSEVALLLINQVHHALGRHRDDDQRGGWISGLAEQQGEAHPTRGGLRIGKRLPERRLDEPIDERLEWDRDGQYFHYLTKWMYALDQSTRSTGLPLFTEWARELAQAAHRAFTYPSDPNRRTRMYWKLSIDLSRPLVGSMGQHDPVDGLVTCLQLQATAGGGDPGLAEAISDFAAMVEPRALATADPLGIGGLLADAYRAAQLERQGAGGRGLTELLLDAALVGLRHYTEQPDLRAPAPQRLAFRELGLAIGLAGFERDDWGDAVRARLDLASRYVPLRSRIETFWLEPAHRAVDSWLEHGNINEVMLATSLHPDGFLVIPPLSAGGTGIAGATPA